MCQGAVDIVKHIAGDEADVLILDMHQEDVANRAKELGINRVPAVLVDGRVAECCKQDGLDGSVLKALLA